MCGVVTYLFYKIISWVSITVTTVASQPEPLPILTTELLDHLLTFSVPRPTSPTPTTCSSAVLASLSEPDAFWQTVEGQLELSSTTIEYLTQITNNKQFALFGRQVGFQLTDLLDIQEMLARAKLSFLQRDNFPIATNLGQSDDFNLDHSYSVEHEDIVEYS